MKELIKKFIPKTILSLYHKVLALLAEQFYGHPSDKLIVIGITGTKGKSTVANLVWHILTQAGYKTGLTSTANIKIGKKERMNPYKMTMPGRFQMQKLLKEMVEQGCQYAIIETTSQGILQWRHLGINYQVVVFTNLYPEHLEAHGGFDKYKAAKLKIFEKNKNKIIIINEDDKESEDFYNCPAHRKIKYSLTELKDIRVDQTGLSFNYQQVWFQVPLLGQFNLSNVLSAIKIGQSQNIALKNIGEYLSTFPGVPGRMELIEEGQNFTVIVDYAHEPQSLRALYQFLNKIRVNKIITVTGSQGGGRDISKRPQIGALAGKYCDYVMVTNEDPYNDDPQKIIDQVAQGAIDQGKIMNKNLFKLLDRRQAIKKAFSLAKKDDIVVLTAKGSEQYMIVKNYKKIPWDERKVARELLKELFSVGDNSGEKCGKKLWENI